MSERFTNASSAMAIVACLLMLGGEVQYAALLMADAILFRLGGALLSVQREW